MRRAPSSGRGVSGRPAPHLPRWEEEGWSGAGARATPLNIREQPCEPSPLPRRDAPAGPGAYT